MAFTPIYELPYQEGSDPPCFGPGTGCDNLESVWCDFAALVEAQLDENDLIIGRTATAIPMAEVRLSTNTLISGGLDPASPTDFPGGYIPYDIVEVDTDNMVVTYLPNGVEPGVLAIAPSRDGVYMIDASIRYSGSAAAMTATFEIVIGTGLGVPGTAGFVANGATRSAAGSGDQFDVRTSTAYLFDSSTGPFPRTLRVRLGPGWNADARITFSRFAVYWHSDL